MVPIVWAMETSQGMLKIDIKCSLNMKKMQICIVAIINEPPFLLITFENEVSLKTQSDSKFSYGPYSICKLMQLSYSFVRYFLNYVKNSTVAQDKICS